MTDRELRRLSRRELIDIIYELQLENDVMKKKLNERSAVLKKSGSIAEAALRLNKVFEAAQSAADQYLESMRIASCDSESRLRETDEQCRKLLEQTEAECNDRIIKTDRMIEKKWEVFRNRTSQYYNEHPEDR